jgi:hypothetical protein
MSGIHLALLGMSFGAGHTSTLALPIEGGFFAGQISTAGNGIADYNLVIAPVSSGDRIQRAMENIKHFNGGNNLCY